MWSRASWLVLLLAISMLIASAGQKAYRITLPIDGWAPAVGSDNLVFERNVLGQPSPIQAGDELLAVDGQDVTDWMRRGLLGELPRPAHWQTGGTVRYTVQRDGQTRDLQVPLYQWNSNIIGLPLLHALVEVVPLSVLTAFVFWKRPGLRAARLLLLIGATYGVMLLNFFDDLPPSIETPFRSTALFWIATICNDDVHDKILPPLFVYLALTFPVRSPPIRRFPRAVVALLVGTPLVLYGFFFLGLSELPTLVWFVGTFVAQIAAVVYNWRTVREPMVRAQARWIGVGYVYASIGTIVAILSFAGVVPRWWDGWVFPLGKLVLTATIAIAILRYRLFDIDVILNRALVYGTLTAFVIGTYVGIVSYAGMLLQGQQSIVPPLVATGLVAVLFQPLRERVQRRVDRMMYGERDDPYAVLTRLGQRLEGTLAVDALLPTIAETVAQALRLPYVAIAVLQGNSMQTAAEYVAQSVPQGTSTHAPAVYILPLVVQGETVGELRLAHRPGEHEWNAADQRLLNDLSRQAGIAVQSARLTVDLRHLTVDLQHSRERLVTAREEERRRLRRDLHDGLGPSLASITLKVDAARNLLRRDVAKADRLLEGVTEQLQTTVADIRRLVYDLRPPALDQLGLVAALKQHMLHLDSRTRIVVQAPDDLPSLPAAVEVAAYRITLEAVTNVLRHAEARQCTVSIIVDRQTLVVDIRDDGRGVPVHHHTGVGLRSMHERAAELGGTCTIEMLTTGGTLVRAHLPLALSYTKVREE